MYKVIGSDQQVYGPVTAAQLQQWLTEGRINLATLVQLEGASDWKPLSTVPGFALPPPVSLPLRAAGGQSDGMAMGALICGVLSIVCCCGGPVFGILGLVFSIIVLNRHPGYFAESSRQLALAGLILSILGLIAHCLLPLFFVLPGGFTIRHFRW